MTAPPSPDALRRLGDFEIVRELGRGGMGVVYEARQISLNRKVALKVLASSLGLTSHAVERFRREAEAAAKLHHTNIVPVYATGEQDGTQFYAMELIEGASLDHVLRQMRDARDSPPLHAAKVASPSARADLAATGPYVETSPTPSSSSGSSSVLASASNYFDTVARMIADVADALDHAHKSGVIHRDIKPSNLLLSSDGRLSVTDFGLARMLETPGMTMTGEFVGTPAYMSPEQITAGRVPLDHRTDIYSLGATLYEMLTLERPFSGDRRDQVLAQILQKEPVPPRRVNKRVPIDLETNCLKAMDKDPDRRYQTAQAMAEDLRRYVNRYAISARRVSFIGRAVKWTRRHPGVAALLGCLLVALLAIGYFAGDATQTAARLREQERQTAMEKAILEAMSGNAPAAFQAIADAENKGASPGQLNLLRGLIEQQRGRPREAIVFLEQAQKQLPGSIAVNALLAQACFEDGQVRRWDELSLQLEQLEPNSAEDCLFLGLLLTTQDPARGLPYLDQALVRSRQSPVARLLRAQAQSNLAAMTGSADDAQRALEDIRKVDLPENPLLLTYRLGIHMRLAHVHRFDEGRRIASLKDAAADVEKLAGYPSSAMAADWRCFYFMYTQDDDALLREARSAQQRVESSTLGDYETYVYYRRRQYDDALHALEKRKVTDTAFWVRLQQGMVFAAIPGKTREAEKALDEARSLITIGYNLAAPGASLYQLLGPDYQQETRKFSKETQANSAHLIPGWRKRWYHDLLAFEAGAITAQQLLDKAGQSRFNQCEAYFYIGVDHLGSGNRAEAKNCFTNCCDTGIFYYLEFFWSRVFLACIDDPTWLPWIPALKE